MDVTKAIPIRTVVVEDVGTKGSVELAVYRDPGSGSIFAVDASFVEQVSPFVPSLYNSGTLQLEEPDASEDVDLQRALPFSRWPGGDDAADPHEYGVTITVDVLATSFAEARQAFLDAVSRGAIATAIFHIEHLYSGTIRELD